MGADNGNGVRSWLDRLLVASLGLVAALIVVLWGLTRSTVASHGDQIDAMRIHNDDSHVAILRQLQVQQEKCAAELSSIRIDTLRELRALDQRLGVVSGQIGRIEAMFGKRNP